MTERERLISILRELNLPPGRWVLSGSGVMVMHGFDRKMGDIDIFVATRTWFELYDGIGRDDSSKWNLFTTDPDDFKHRSDPAYLYRVINGIEVNIFCQWRRRGVGDIDVGFWLHNAEMVDGWPCIPLPFLLYWKQEVGRAKDVDDIRVLKEHLGK